MRDDSRGATDCFGWPCSPRITDWEQMVGAEISFTVPSASGEQHTRYTRSGCLHQVCVSLLQLWPQWSWSVKPHTYVNVAKYTQGYRDGIYIKENRCAYGHWHLCTVRDAAGSEMSSGAAVGLRLKGEAWKGTLKASWTWGKEQKGDIVQKLQRPLSCPTTADKTLKSAFTKSCRQTVVKGRWSETQGKTRDCALQAGEIEVLSC